jgi:pimeloyl-ACP methyl ester carboxylesterase
MSGPRAADPQEHNRRNGMLSTPARHLSACMATVILLAGVQTAETQRTAESVHPVASAPRSGGSDAVVPFKIHVSDAVLTDLKQRLSRARLADDIPDAGWDYGTNGAYLKQLVDYWRDRYDWRAQEKRLNQFDQFMTNIDGLNIHFLHQRAKSSKAMPLLLLNGWPSSIMEYSRVIGPLTDPVAHGGRAEDAFDVVIPVMPGYGFSDKPRERGYNPERMAGMWVKLMARLGYTRYGAHGSDWGNGIASRMALKDADHMVGLHLAGCGGAPVAPAPAADANAPPQAPFAAINAGYQEIQATKPQTLGQGLSDSPVGLAAWIIDKWYNWTDHDGDLEKVYTKDELLTNIMFYWVTNTGTSSTRIYYESRHDGNRLLPTLGGAPIAGRITVPTGCGAFPTEYWRRSNPTNPMAPGARAGAETRYNLVHYTVMPRGGHFPAFEAPTLWLDDIRVFFSGRR